MAEHQAQYPMLPQQQGYPPQTGYNTQYGMQQPPPGQGAYGMPAGGYGQPAPGQPGMIIAQPQPGQPGQPVTWMQPPPPPPGCPPGMEYLCHLDQILVKQETSLLEVLTGWEVKNKFRLLNSVGQQVYYAMEESETCNRICCGPQRGFVYHITDNMQQEVFRIRRDFECCTGANCCPCESCFYFAQIEDRNGTVLGHVSNLHWCCKPLFGIWDANKSLMAEVRGPCCPCQNVCCTADIEMPIFDVKSNTEIGKISKQWPGLLKEMFTDSDNFRVTFPADMDVKTKALMIGAVFIVDMMLYEQKQNNNN